MALTAALSPGCGGGPATSDEDGIHEAVRALQRAFAAGDMGRVCRLLSDDARAHVRALGHDLDARSSQPCYFDIYMFADGIRKAPGWRARSERPIRDVEVHGSRATATVEFEDGQTARLPFVREDGRWRVDALFGGIPAGRQRDSY